MQDWQKIVVVCYTLFSIIAFIKGVYEVLKKKNRLGDTHIFNLIGAFVWADAVVFGFFWTIFSVVVYFLNDWVLFLLGQALFWVVRSVGETVYWFNQQFSQINRNPLRKNWIFKIFGDEYTGWFIYQISWQCITVVALILSLHFARLWLAG